MSQIIHIVSKLTIEIVAEYGLLGILVLMTLEAASIPFPSFITMPFAGFLVSRGYWHLGVIILIGTLGNSLGGSLAFWFGYKKGETWIRTFIRKFGKFILLSEAKFDKGINLFNQYDKKIIFVSRIIPIVRAFTSLPAGVARLNFSSFLLLSTLGNILYVAFLSYLGFILGENWAIITPIFKKFQYLIFISFILIIIFYLYKRKKKN